MTLPVLEVDLGPRVRAGFTTRAGGVSGGAWGTLNVGLAVGDDEEHVLTNRERVERWAGGPVVYANQVHGAQVAVLDDAARTLPRGASAGDVDALVSTSAGLGVAVYVADCVPVLLADADAGLVAAVHAGRPGLAAGVVGAAVAALRASGAEPARLRAVVGPSISGGAYEVPEQMRADVAALVPEAWAVTTWGTPALDLAAGVVAELWRAGVKHVDRLPTCTWADERLYSHRRAVRDGTTTGRFAGVVRITG
ncbi:peptidoglycan editing factor PgeF [Cellulomonas sp. P22]|uniref:peptidoglycan editing factor PgeF n=1 Tax=Cellulomonas sp. P22 TaxID=3373189 RepID=UPI0037AABB58